MKRIYTTVLGLFLTSTLVLGQANIQFHHDFGRSSDHSSYETVTLEGYYEDEWGSTFLFTDFDISKQSYGYYTEISRCFNLWRTSKLKDLSLQLEMDGGVYRDFLINPALLTGVQYLLYAEDWKWNVNLQCLYKTFFGREYSKIPLQFTVVWTVNNLFGIEKLQFSGFADYWWQDQMTIRGQRHSIFMSEPQLWYGLFRTIDIGGELEVSYNFDCYSQSNWTVYPTLGIRWNL